MPRSVSSSRRPHLSLLTLEDRSVPAVVSYTGVTYSQDFDAMPASFSPNPLTFTGSGPFFLDADSPGTPNVNFGLTGWQIFRNAGTNANLLFRADDGGSNSGSANNYGVAGVNPATDRALGSLASGSNSAAYGVTFKNDTTNFYDSFTIEFNQEQWRRGSTTAELVSFSFRVGAANINDGTFTAATQADLTSVPGIPVNAGKLDGNDKANRLARSETITGAVWGPGELLTIRWVDADNAGADDGLAIDDFKFTAKSTGANTPTTLVLTSDKANPSVGTSISFTAAVTSSKGIPTGSFDFFANGRKLNAAAIPADSSGKASITVGTNFIQAVDGKQLTPGINDISASFTGTGIYLPSSDDLPQPVQSAPFTTGNILVFRTGDGFNAMSASGNRFYIDEYAPTGSQTDPIQSIIMPTIALGDNKPVLASGVQSNDGQLSVSSDGKFAIFGAYNALPNNLLSLTAAPATTIPRAIGRINLATGAIETSMALTDVASTASFRSAIQGPGGSLYATGSFGGVRYISDYNAATTTSTDLGNSINWTSLRIFGNTPQLYGSALPNVPPTNPKVGSIGTGLPTSGTPTVTPLPGLPLDDASVPRRPVDFFMADLSTSVDAGGGIDTLYISEFGDASFSGGTITKWSWDPTGMAWTLNGTIIPPGILPGVDNSFARITGSTSGTAVTLFATQGAGGGGNNGGGSLWTVTDTAGYNQPFSTTTLTLLAQHNLGSLKTFRGAAIIPPSIVAPPVVSGIVVNNGDTQRSRIVTITVNFAAPVDASLFQTAGAVTLTRLATTPTGGLAGFVVNNSNGLQIAPASGSTASITLTFANVLNNGVENQSLADGRWQLAVVPASFTSNDGTQPIRRLFGDQDGNGTTDGTDFGVFGTAFGGPNVVFDWDANGTVDGADFGQFGTRVGVTI